MTSAASTKKMLCRSMISQSYYTQSLPTLKSRHKKKGPIGPFFGIGGVDGIRTRDPMRDRHVF